MKANASKHKAMSYERMKKDQQRLREKVSDLLAKAEQVDEEEDAVYGKGRSGKRREASDAFSCVGSERSAGNGPSSPSPTISSSYTPTLNSGLGYLMPPRRTAGATTSVGMPHLLLPAPRRPAEDRWGGLRALTETRSWQPRLISLPVLARPALRE